MQKKQHHRSQQWMAFFFSFFFSRMGARALLAALFFLQLVVMRGWVDQGGRLGGGLRFKALNACSRLMFSFRVGAQRFESFEGCDAAGFSCRLGVGTELEVAALRVVRRAERAREPLLRGPP
jgi:hypothetical protein